MDHRTSRTDATRATTESGPAPVPDQLRAPDLMADDIEEAVRDVDDGRLSRARRRLGALWAQAPLGTAHRSAVAHWLAAVEQELEAKLGWDERALEAAEEADDWSMPFAGTALTLGAFYPELHLELARDYRRLGSSCGALEHLALARNAVEASARGVRRTALRRQLARLGREIDGMRDWYPESEPFVDLWDDEGLV